MSKIVLGLMFGGVAALPFFGAQTLTPLPQTANSAQQKQMTGAVVNPNARNLDQFLTTVRNVGLMQGKQMGEISSITAEMRKYALATTTDFLAQFIKESKTSARKMSYASPFAEKIAVAFEKVSEVFLPRADAAGLSFGGFVTYVFPCTCSGNWLVGLFPTSIPPIVLITHYQGAQMFMNFNAPFTLQMLGLYSPGGACLFYAGLVCVPLPSQAMTTPFLGSS